MKITSETLKKIILQEMNKLQSNKTIREGSASRPIKVSPAYINRLIKEEYIAFKNEQRIVEARRRRRLAEARRRRRLAESRRRKNNETVYFY